MTLRLGIDLGETRADLLLHDGASGASYAAKTPLSANDTTAGLASGITALAHRAQASPGAIAAVVVALPENAAAGRVGLLVTQGFEGALRPPGSGAEIAVAGVAERMSAEGDVIAPLDEAAAARATAQVLAEGVDAVAICFLNAHRNAAHEIAVRDLVEGRAAGLPVLVSHAVAPEAGEAARAHATVLAARAAIRSQTHLDRVAAGLASAEVAAPIGVLQPTGARTDAETAMADPVGVAGGPAAAASAAARCAREAGFDDALALDLGGSAAAACLIRKGAARVGQALPAKGREIPVPAVDVRTLGPGLGAMATAPAPGQVRVGPGDAAPACTGGTGGQPTVMDALAVLRRLPAETLALDVPAAEGAIAGMADTLGVGLHRAAEGIVGTYADRIAGALRALAVEKGEDPGRMALVASGGAGPILGAAIAESAGIWPVIVPAEAATLSALGCATAPTSKQFTAPVGQAIDSVDPDTLGAVMAGLQTQAEAFLAGEGLSGEGLSGQTAFRADIRFRRGGFRTSLSLRPAEIGDMPALLHDLSTRASTAYRDRFGHLPGHVHEIASIRAIATAGAPPAPTRPPDAAMSGAHAPQQTQIWFDGGFRTAAVVDGGALVPGKPVKGPAMIVRSDTTVIVPPACSAEMDGHGTILLRPSGDAGRQ